MKKELKEMCRRLAYILGVSRNEVHPRVSCDGVVYAEIRGEVFYFDLFNL